MSKPDQTAADAAAVLLDARRHVLRVAADLEAAAAEQRKRAGDLQDKADRLRAGQLPLPGGADSGAG